MPVKDLCLKRGFSEVSYYRWRSKCGGLSVSEAKRLKDLETENGRLKKLVAEQLLEDEVIKDALRRKWWAHRTRVSWRAIWSVASHAA